MKADKQTVTGGPQLGRSQEKVILTLVVPTRNEAENIPKLVRETPEVIHSLSEQDGRIHLVHREGTERYRGTKARAQSRQGCLDQGPRSHASRRTTAPGSHRFGPERDRTGRQDYPPYPDRYRPRRLPQAH